MSLVESEASSPRLEDFVRVLADENPWRLRGQVPPRLAKAVERPLAAHLWRALLAGGRGRYHLLSGPRRVGKSTIMYQTVARLREVGVPPERLVWVRLEHPLLIGASVERLLRRWLDSVGARPESPAYLFLDEVPFAHEWDRWLRNIVDERWPVCVVASASTDPLRERRLVVGNERFEDHLVAPYHLGEVVSLLGGECALPLGATYGETLVNCARAGLGDPDLETRRLLLSCAGGFPELLQDVSGVVVLADLDERLARSERLLSTEVVERAIYKDLPRSERVEDPGTLERLLYTLAVNIGECLRLEEICAEVPGQNAGLIERKIAQLERAHLVHTLPHYVSSERDLRKRPRRSFFVDGAVRNAVLRRGLAPLRDPEDMTRTMANLAANHIRLLARHLGAKLSYWGDRDLHVDFVLSGTDEPMAFALGSEADRPRRALTMFAEHDPQFAGRCWHVSPLVGLRHPNQAPDGIGTLPLDLFLLSISQQVDQEVRWRLAE